MTILKNNHKSGINENNIKVATVTEEQQVQTRALTPGTLPLPTDYPIRAGAQVYQVSTTGTISYPDHPECSSQRNIFCKVTVTAGKKFKTISKAMLKIEKYGGDTNGEFAVWEASENQMLQTVYCSNYLKTVTMQNDKTYAVIDITEHVKSGESKVFYLAITSEDGSMLVLNNTGIVEVAYVEDDDLIPSGKLEKQVGSKGGYSINARNGKLQYNQQIFASKGGLMPFGLSLSYNATNCDSSSPNGIANGMKGWTFNYQQSLMTGLGKMLYVDASNVVHTFKNPTNNSNVWFDATGKSGMVLVETATGYSMSDGKTTTLNFDTSKRLVSVEQRLSSSKTIATAIEYMADGKISQVTDGLGDVYILAWEHEDGYNGVRISKVLNETTETLLAEISLTDERVTQVKYVLSGDTVDFAYDSNGQLISVLDSASQQKALFEYNTVGGISAVKNYIRNVDDEGHITDMATDSNHFEYKLLQTRISSCRNSDTKSNAYCTMAYLFAEDGELLTTAEVKGNTLQPLRCKTKKDFERSSATIPDKLMAQAMFGEEEAVQVTGDFSSDTFSVDTRNQVFNTYFFTATARIESNNYVGNDDQKMLVQIVEGEDVLGTAEFDPSKREDESVCGAIILSPGEHDLSARLVLTNLRSTVVFGNIKLYATKNGIQKQYSNIAAVESSAREHDGTTETPWYEHDYCSLYKDGSVVAEDVVFNANDYALTLISRLQNPTAYNVWYNDGKNMLYQVSNVSLVRNDESKTLEELKVCTLSSTLGKTIFEYLVPHSTYLYKARKVTTFAIEGGLDGAVAEECVTSNFQTGRTRDERAVYTEYTYDANGSVVKVKTYSTAADALNIEESSTYNDHNLLQTSKSRRYLVDYTQSFVYGTDYELTKDTQPNGLITQFDYSADKDKLTSIGSTLDGQTSQNSIQYSGDLIQKLADCEIDENIPPRTIVDFDYDERHNISQVKIGNEVVLEKEITYNADGTTQSVTTYGNGQKIKKYYDRYDRLIKVSDVSSGELVLVQYIYNDTEIDKSTFNVATFTPTVSANSPLRVVVDRFADTTWYTYDQFGQLEKTEKQSLITTRTQDDFNRVASIGVSFGGENMSTAYTYASPTDNTLVAEETLWNMPGEISTTYTHDGLQRPAETTVMVGNNGYKQAFEYVPRQKREKLPNGEISVGGLPSFTFVTTDIGTTNYISKFKEYSMSGTTATLVRTDAVEYDANGNITKYGDVTYEYDKLGRLTKEINPTIDRIKEWCYDISGNILSRTEHKYTTGEALGTFEYEYETGWKDQLKSFNNQAIEYDDAGNPTTYRGKTLTWTRGRLLASYTPSGSIYTTTMQYDADGRRCRKTIPTSSQPNIFSYIYNGNNLIRETKSDTSSATKTYLYNSQGIIGFVYQGVTYTYRKNLFGDIVAIYQGSTKVAEYAYDAWGNQKVMNGNSIEVTDLTHIAHVNPFRYRGYYWDNDLGLYYLMSRYYDPQTGRFINADSLEYLDPETIGGLNLYAYCGNNPVMGVDPLGTISITLLAGLIGFGISFISSIISQATDKEEGEINWGVAIVDGIFGAIDGVLSASGLKLNPVLDTVLDVCLDVLNNSITTLIKNKGEVSGKDLLNVGISAAITGIFSFTSARKNWGFDGDFIKRVQPEMKNINRKLSEGLYKTTQKAMNAQKTIRSYFNQAFSSDVYKMYGMDIMANVMKGILT